MASTYSPKLRFELIGAGEQAGLWGTTTNKNVGQLIEQAIAGVTTVDLDGVTGNYTLTALDGAPDQSRSAVIKCAYSAVPAAGTVNVIIPTQTKLYVFRNDCGQTIYVKTTAQVGGVEILDGESTLVFCDGTNAIPGIETAAVGTLTVSGGGTGSTTFSAGFIKSPGGTGAFTSSSTVALGSEVSGTLPVANGGTGATTFTSGALLKGNGAGAIAVASASDIVTAIGSTAVTNATNATSATTATNIAGGAANRIAYNTGSGATGFITAPSVSSTYLQWTGSAFTWATVSTGGVTSVTASSPLSSSGGATPNITFSGTLDVANGGTGSSSSSGARSNLDVPSTSGSGATGTWGIGISGNAATVTNGVYTTDFTGSNQSKSASGYQKLPGGLIIQWGSNAIAGNTVSITFPTTFPSACSGLTVSRYKSGSTGGVAEDVALATTPTTSGFTASTPTAGDSIFWIAIGY